MSTSKIAFVIPSLDSGGAERVVTTLANSLVNNYKVFIITFIKSKSFYKLDDSVVLINCVDSIKPSSNILDALKNNYLLLKKINKAVKKNEINLLIGFLTSANVLSVLTAKFNRIPVIISERNNPYLQKPQIFWRLLRSISYAMANYVVVQTTTIKKFYLKKIKRDRLVILPNPISEELSLKRNTILKKKNLILNVGRLTDQKAQDVLIKAFAHSDNDNWKLVIAGEGPNRSQYEILINDLRLGEKVVLMGSIKNIEELYNQAKIFAFSSIYEGFPNALIEAMHYGLACVSTDCPTGPSELINDGSNGFLISVNDVPMMTEKLNLLMQDENIIKKFGSRAAASVEKFESKNVVTHWKKLIENCLV